VITFSSKTRRTGLGAVLATITVLAGALVPTPAFAATPDEIAACPWLDTSKTADERAHSLLDASTLQQKFRWLNEQAANTPASNTFSGVTYVAPPACLPTVIYTDGPDGTRSLTGVTAFPNPLAVAATWDDGLAFQRGTAIADEAFDKRKNVVLGPGIATGRYTLSGRTPEYMGEDPLLMGNLAAQTAKGIESNKAKPVMSDIKHYVANEQELARQTSSSNIDERTFQEAYQLPFEIVAAKGKPGSVMCSYNQINGVYSCENPILNTELKGRGGFDGFVMSDFGAVHSTAASLNAGLDLELNRPKYYTPTLLQAALDAGQITEQQISDAAFRVVRSYIKAGLFDVPLPATAVTDASTAEHKELSQKVAEESIVLLKNSHNVLPLKNNALAGKSVAIIGPTASATPTSGVSAKSTCSMGTSNNGTLSCSNLTTANDPATLIAARATAEGATSVTFTPALTVDQATTAATGADVAIVFGFYKAGEFSDIGSLALPNDGDAIIAAAAAAAGKTIVILETGSATAMPWLDKVDGVFEAWYAGDQKGAAYTSLLFGDTSPSGKLPMTFPKSMAESPVTTNAGTVVNGITQLDFTEGLQVGYKWYDQNDVAPLFEFGKGLSYADFNYSDLSISTTQNNGSPVTQVSLKIRNVSDIAADEIPQVYLTLPRSANEPGKRLVAYDRVSLAPDETKTVSFTIDADAPNHPFSTWNVDTDKWEVADGQYTVSVGSSSRDLRQTAHTQVDTAGVAPTVSVDASPASPDGQNGWYSGALTLTPTASDDVDPAPVVEANIDGAGWATVSGAVSVTGDGAHEVAFRATDFAGNTSADVTWTGKLDRTAPVTSATVDEAARTVTVRGADATSGLDHVEVRIGDADWATYTGPVKVGDAQTTVAFRGVDKAGNKEEAGSATVPKAGVTLAKSMTAALVSKPSVRYFDPNSVSVRVTGGQQAPTGSVSIVANSVVVGSATLSGGRANVALNAALLVPGSYTLEVRYSGDAVYEASSDQVQVDVAKAVSSIKGKFSASKIKRSTSPKLTATVRSTAPISGSVTIKEGSKVLKAGVAVPTNGKVTVKLPKLKKGTHKVTVYFSGSATIAESKSSVIKIKVK